MTNIEGDMYGRVSSISLITWAINPAALLVLGAFVDRLGAPPVVTVQGLLLAAFIFGIALAYPRVWRQHGAQIAQKARVDSR